MSITLAQLIVWLIIDAIAGWLVGTVVPDKWAGLNRWTGLGVGLVGALIGGLISVSSEFGQASMRLPSRFGIS